MQDTWLVTDAGGVPLSRLPMEIYVQGMNDGLVRRGRTASSAAGGAAATDLDYRAYHDDEWGLPVSDDRGCSRSSASRASRPGSRG